MVTIHNVTIDEDWKAGENGDNVDDVDKNSTFKQQRKNLVYNLCHFVIASFPLPHILIL